MTNQKKIILALALSNLIPKQISMHKLGKVHSKFDSGLNVQFGDSLVYIGRGNDLSAFAISLADHDLTGLLANVAVDEVVINKENRLVFYTIGGIIELCYDKAQQVDLRIPAVNCSIDGITNTELYNYLLAMNLTDKIGLEQNDGVGYQLDFLLDANKRDDCANLASIIFFKGRGIGLTPSGDDLLLGFTLALCVFGKFEEWMQCMRVVDSQRLTTDISVAYSSALLEGYISAACVDLVLALDIQDREQIKRIVAKVAEHGHTSGYDTLYGFLLGLQFLAKKMN